MIGTRTSEGWEIVARPHGIGRFFSAGFLGFWLCGWAIGEAFALGFLGVGAWALLTGTPPGPGRAPLELGPALAVGTFLIVWVSFWTLGGVLAITEFLRLVSSEDRLVVHPGGITIRRRRGPFFSHRDMPRDELRRAYRLPRKSMLVLATTRGTIEFAELGHIAEAEEALTEIRREAGLSDDTTLGRALPAGWEEITSPKGERLVVRDRRIRRTQTRIAAGFALAAATVAAVLFVESGRTPEVAPMAWMAAGFATLIAAGAVWLARGRTEWLVDRGRIVIRRRFGDRVEDVLEVRGLALRTHSDSDGDDWFTLDGQAGGEAAKRKTLVSVIHDPSEAQAVGAWLAERAGIALDDATGRAFMVSGRSA